MTNASQAPCRFGRFELQPRERRLLENGAPVPVAARAFDVLVLLAQRSGHLVTKDELMDHVWSPAIVEENTVQGQIAILRKILGAGAIATVSGRGYRFELQTVAVPDTKAGRAPKHNLPRQLTSFIGRGKERTDLQQLLLASRLVTLTGAGGCGKTRLALEVAGDALQQYPDGVWLVELAPLTDPELVPQSIADALHVTQRPGRSLVSDIVDWVEHKRTLILLDNAEHMLAACARMVETILRSGAEVAVLATSRTPLGISGEHTFRVPSLSVPAPRSDSPEVVRASESAQLFIERARQQRPGFEITGANAPALATICRQLDGIPLALELAAPRVRSMSVEEVARRLTRSLKVLVGGSPTAQPRQRTLRSLIDWSYDLLTEHEQALLRRLSTFSGGFDAAAAEQSCAGDGIEPDDVVETLTSLCDKSLVLADEAAGTTRYRLQETVRQYALERLTQHGEEARWRERHFRHVLAFATALAPFLSGSRQKESLARLDAEHDNLRAALGWSLLAGNAKEGLELANAVHRFWWVRQHLAEASTWFAQLLAATRDLPVSAARGRGLTSYGLIRWKQGNVPAARALHEQSLQIARALGDAELRGAALGNLVIVAIEEDDYAAAKAIAEELLAERRALGDLHAVASSLGKLGVIYIQLGDAAGARRALEEAFATWQRLGDLSSAATTLCNLAVVANIEGNHAAALAFAADSLALARSVGDARAEALALNMLGTTECARGDTEAGVSYLRESLLAHHSLGVPYGVTEVCDSLASACRTTQPVRAARIWGGLERVRAEFGFLKRPFLRPQHARDVADARAALADEAAFEAAWQAGRAMNLDAVVAYVLQDAGR